MRQTTGILLCTVGLAAAPATELLAQVSRAPASVGFVNINVGAQPRRQSFGSSGSLPIYGETATFTTSQQIGNGPIFELGAGYRVWRGLAVEVGFSTFSKKGDNNVSARVPHQLFFDSFATATAAATGLEHTERVIHLAATWFVPVTEKIDVALSAGPAFVTVDQAFVASVSVPVGTQNIAVAPSTASVSSTGGMVAFDGAYMFHRNIGAGLFLRYVGSTVTVPGVGDLKVGGFQAGLGARIRF